jgi:antitoxin ParD1/3/4
VASSVALGNLERSVERLVASGRYHLKSEVLREGVRLVEEREKRLELLNAALARGVADADAGHLKPVRDVFERLTTKYEAMAKARGE